MEHVQLFEEYTYPKKDTNDIDKTVEQIDDLLAKIYAKKIDYPQVDKEMKRISANEADFTKEAHDKFEKATAIILKTFKVESKKEVSKRETTHYPNLDDRKYAHDKRQGF